jgi:hypothetical protein
MYRSYGGSAIASADSAFLFTFLSEWKADNYNRLWGLPSSPIYGASRTNTGFARSITMGTKFFLRRMQWNAKLAGMARRA